MANSPKQGPDETTVPELEIIVRRGAIRRFDRLKKTTTDLPVKLSWDRRLHDRRAGVAPAEGEHQREERRKAPPFTWETADFVVVDPGPLADDQSTT